jgi:hypothetical protein
VILLTKVGEEQYSLSHFHNKSRVVLLVSVLLNSSVDHNLSIVYLTAATDHVALSHSSEVQCSTCETPASSRTDTSCKRITL